MGLWNWLRTQATGVDVDETQRQSDAADAALRREIETDRQNGTISDQVAAQSQAHVSQSEMNAAQDVNQAFIEGALEGAQAEVGAVTGVAGAIGSAAGNAVAGVARPLLGSIPVVVWILAAVFLFFYFGGLQKLKR